MSSSWCNLSTMASLLVVVMNTGAYVGMGSVRAGAARSRRAVAIEEGPFRGGDFERVENDPFARPGPQAEEVTPAVEEGAEYDIRRGARILGATVGGTTGNFLWSGVERLGLQACTPFSLDGCADVKRPIAAAPAPSGGGGSGGGGGIELPPELESFLRNPTSVLPSDFLKQMNEEANKKYLAPPPSVPEVAPAPTAAEASAQLSALRERLAQLQEGLPPPSPGPELPGPLSSLASPPLPSVAGGVEQVATAFQPVPPASAWSDAAGVLPATELDFYAAVHSPPAQGWHTTLDTAGFAAVADGGGASFSSLVATVLFAAAGALLFESMATSPMPDPTMAVVASGVRTASKYADMAAMAGWSASRPVREAIAARLPKF